MEKNLDKKKIGFPQRTKITLDPYLTWSINVRWIKDINVMKQKFQKLLEKKIFDHKRVLKKRYKNKDYF
jgi:hypothetical protein